MISQKSSLLAAVSVVSILAASPMALASDTQLPTNATVQGSVKVDADKLIGKNLVNGQNEKVGEIESVLIDKNGHASAVVVGVGGFLGIGERDVAIDWNSIDISKGGEDVYADFTREQLKAMPVYKYKKQESKGTSFLDTDYLKKKASAAATTTKKAAGQAYDETKEAAGDAYDKTKEMASDAATKTKQMAGVAVDQTKSMASNAKDKITGNTEWIKATGKMTAGHLMGADVVNTKGDTIGEVDDVVLDKSGIQLVLSPGGMLDVNAEKVVLELERAEVLQQRDDPDDIQIKLAMTEEELKALPRFVGNP